MMHFADVVTEQNVIGIAASSSGQPKSKKEFLNPKWSPGFKLGLGWMQEQWDAKLSWAWLTNHSHRTINAVTTSALDISTGLSGTENGLGIYGTFLGEWLPADVQSFIDEVPVQLVNPGPFTKAKLSSNLFYTTIDAETGYSIFGKINTVRFLFGARSAIINRHVKADYTGYSNLGSLLTFVPTINGFTSGSYKGKNNFWGIGPRFGVYDELAWRCGIRLFGQFSSALLYGTMSESNTSSLYDFANGVSTLFGGTRSHTPRKWVSAGNIQGLFGLGWKKSFCNFDFGVTATWESNLWLMPSLSSPIYDRDADLTLNGVNIALEFKY
jgi:hypothetical protein